MLMTSTIASMILYLSFTLFFYNSANNLSNLQKKKIKLCNTKEEREAYDQLANLFGIIRAVEGLEKAFAWNGTFFDFFMVNFSINLGRYFTH